MMNANVVSIFDRVSPTVRRGPLTMKDAGLALAAIERTLAWMDRARVLHCGFGFGPKGVEIEAVACSTLYKMAKGEARRFCYEQVGAMRFEVWTFKSREGVNIYWKEVVACA